MTNRWCAARASVGSEPSDGPTITRWSSPRSVRARRRAMHRSGGPSTAKPSANSGVSRSACGRAGLGVPPHVVGVVHLLQQLPRAVGHRAVGGAVHHVEPREGRHPPAGQRPRRVDVVVAHHVDERARAPRPAARRGRARRPSATRSGSAPRAKVTRSAWRAAASITFGPVAATVTGTFGRSGGSQCSRLAVGPTGEPQRTDLGHDLRPERRRSPPPRRGGTPAPARGTRSNTETGAGASPRWASAESPRPMPSTARPPDGGVHAGDGRRRHRGVSGERVGDAGAQPDPLGGGGRLRERHVAVAGQVLAVDHEPAVEAVRLGPLRHAHRHARQRDPGRPHLGHVRCSVP